MQVLNALAPLQQEQGDVSGADSMLKSSFTLSKNLHDLHSQVLQIILHLQAQCSCSCPAYIRSSPLMPFSTRENALVVDATQKEGLHVVI